MISSQIAKHVQERETRIKQQVSKARPHKSTNHQESSKGNFSGAADESLLQRRREVDGHDDFILESEKADVMLANITASIPFPKWANLVGNLLKRNNWSRLGDLAKVLSKVPDDVAMMFDWNEKAKGLILDEETRLKFYKEFTRSALGANMLHFEEVNHWFASNKSHLHTSNRKDNFSDLD